MIPGGLVLAIWLLYLSQVSGQFHRECVTSEALREKVCCPAWDGSPCGELAGHGKCSINTSSEHSSAPEDYHHSLYDPSCMDDRMFWPHGHFKHYCQCYGNYSGYNCGQCKYGHYGDKCDQRKTLIRREIRSLHSKERMKFIRYLKMAKTTTSRDFVILVSENRTRPETFGYKNASVYDIFVWIHHYATKPILINCSFMETNFAHNGPGFLTWHRMSVMYIEREIQRLTGDDWFAMPYYNWSNDATCKICTNSFMGSSDKNGMIANSNFLASWETICFNSGDPEQYCSTALEDSTMYLQRDPGHGGDKRMPTYQDVQNSLQWEVYDKPPYNMNARCSFRNTLEGNVSPKNGKTDGIYLHNAFHDYLNGMMADTSMASNDPMFILHHCYVDSILEMWTSCYGGNPEMYPENDIPGQGPLDFVVPFYPYLRNKDLLQSSLVFGYSYE
ncbi:tyrosinase-like [Hyperolius riggenbachi]|uniref:tyrosinase-like n=1 Tax=Hyperolius riggenbachi TaxID=752182 RepID=UPI0035A2EDBA